MRENFKIRFEGSAGEYFKIWIVNTLLTIVTLGIYSAWAKVRNRKYLYGNTIINDGRLDYTADPKKILVGRVILGVFFIAYLYGPLLHYSVGLIAVSGFILLFPWIVVKGSIFNLTNTTYKNVRFDFTRNLKASYKNYSIAGLITLCSLGLAWAWAYCRHKDFTISNSFYGQKKFKFNATGTDFFTIFFMMGLIYLLIVVCLALIVGALAYLLTGTLSKEATPVVGMVITYVFLGLGLIYITSFHKTKIINLVVNSSSLEGIDFRARLETNEYFKILFVNAVAIVVSLGLLTPWALIRLYRYKCNNIQLIADDSKHFDEFIQEAKKDEGSAADAALDFWDFDIGF